MYLLLFSDFNGTWNVLTNFQENTLNFMKICPVGAELFHVDEETDRHEETRSHFHNFVNAPKKTFSTHFYCHFKRLKQHSSFLVTATHSHFSPLDCMHAVSCCVIDHYHYMCPSLFPIPPAASLIATDELLLVYHRDTLFNLMQSTEGNLMSSSQLIAWDKPMVYPFLSILLPNFLENSTASLLDCGSIMSCCSHTTVLQQT